MREKFLQGVALFNRGLYFDAHEVWEEAWNDAEGNPKRCLQALIQLAVALLKWQSGIPGGAMKMHAAATAKLAQLPDECLGLDVRKLETNFKDFCRTLCEAADAPFPERPFPELIAT